MEKESKKVINIGKNKHKYRNTTIRKIEEKIKGSSILIYNNVCAVALKYEQGVIKIPILTYKSKNVKASKLAAFNIGLPVFKNKIASDIAFTLKKNNPIIPEMYVPVATLLAEIYNKTYEEILDFENLLDDTIFYTHFKSKLKIEVGKDLEKMIKSSDFTEKIEEVRKDIVFELGLALTPIKVKVDLDLPPNKYLIKLGENKIGEGNVYPDRLKTAITTTLAECIKNNAGDLLTRYNIYQLLDKLRINNSEEYVDDILDKVSIGKIQAVLTSLLNENVPIKELEKILESISIISSKDKDNDIELLVDKARTALSRTICERNISKSGELLVISMTSEVEDKILEHKNNRNMPEKDIVKEIITKLETKIEKTLKSTNELPIILCSVKIRSYFRNLIERKFPKISILSYNDIHKNYKLKNVGIIDI